MSRGLHSCRPESSVGEAEQIMRTHQVRRIPVVNPDGRLAGVLSLADIAREAAHHKGGHAKDIGAEEVVSLLESLSQPQQRAQRV